ncbi:ATP-binding protein [Streptomyces sp. NPDC057413]|uniref:ATP-binding protein n=1 Tax=unclassified Streptomyces TaxID=2593676 RepID=UPI0036477E67
MTDLLLAAGTTVALAATGSTWHFHRAYRRERDQAARLRGQAEQLTEQLRAAEYALGQLTSEIPGLAAGSRSADDLAVPHPLAHTPLAARLRDLTGQVTATVTRVRDSAQASADEHAARIRSAADQEVEKAHREAREATRAAVRSFASNVVAKAARLSREISQGVRSHQDDEAYATLVHIDHIAQQMLLTAQGYAVLAGDKLSRRWPRTTLTDVIRAAMGRIEGYQRIEHHELDTVAVESRAVEAVVHTLALLLDNALRYSPPTARVHVSVEQGHHACFLIVDDAGLRMDDERLLWASDIMSGKHRDDITRLGAHPQTGLRVASLLAENYGFRVELTAPNIYQGTRAVLVLPKSLLTTPAAPAPRPAAAERAPAPEPAARPEPAAAPAPREATTALAPTEATAVPEPAEPDPAVPATAAVTGNTDGPAPEEAAEPAPVRTTASGLTVRQRPPRARTASARPAEEAVVPGRPGVAAAWAAGTRRGRQMPEDHGSSEGH